MVFDGGTGCGKGIRWKCWDKLCVVKVRDGMGFNKLKHFNLVMLAKQGWMPVNNDNPLVTACMKTRYFSGGDFLTATMGANPSFMWRNILCWSIWNRRNKWIWDIVNVSVFGTKSNAFNLLAAWKKAHDQ